MNLASLPGNQLVFLHVLLVLCMEQLPLELGLYLSNHMPLPKSHIEVRCSISLGDLVLFSVGRCNGS